MKNFFSLEGKAALITGATGGIGAASAKRLALAGAKVVLTGRNEEKGKAIANEINQTGGTAMFIKQDVTVEEEWKDVVQKTVDVMGGLDILLNNAGINKGNWLRDMSEEEFMLVMRTNLLSQFFGVKYAIRAMEQGGIAGKGGSIINMSSTSATRTSPGSAAYCISKAAIIMLTKSAARECNEKKSNIRVNSIVPSTVDTDFPVSRVQEFIEQGIYTPEQGKYVLDHCFDSMPLGPIAASDIADVVHFLASDASKKITAAEFVVDAGRRD